MGSHICNGPGGLQPPGPALEWSRRLVAFRPGSPVKNNKKARALYPGNKYKKIKNYNIVVGQTYADLDTDVLAISVNPPITSVKLSHPRCFNIEAAIILR